MDPETEKRIAELEKRVTELRRSLTVGTVEFWTAARAADELKVRNCLDENGLDFNGNPFIGVEASIKPQE